MSDLQVPYLPLPLPDGKEHFHGFETNPPSDMVEPGVFFLHDVHARLSYSGTPECARCHIEVQAPTDPNRMRILRPLVLAIMIRLAQCEPDGVEVTLDQLRDEALQQLAVTKTTKRELP